MLPGSRVGEVSRHIAPLAGAAARFSGRAAAILATPAGFSQRAGSRFFSERIPDSSIQVIEGETWDAIAHADVALAASGTVTVEAALLGTPMVTYYRVNPLSWTFGRHLVRVPFYSMVNLIAERKIVPELMQEQMTGARVAAEVNRLLESPLAREAMKRDLAEVAGKLTTQEDPMERASAIIAEFLEKDRQGR
jgi:lipid-A-disaccharide synthase